MSVINDALKKVQTDFANLPPVKNDFSSPQPLSHSTPKKQTKSDDKPPQSFPSSSIKPVKNLSDDFFKSQQKQTYADIHKTFQTKNLMFNVYLIVGGSVLLLIIYIYVESFSSPSHKFPAKNSSDSTAMFEKFAVQASPRVLKPLSPTPPYENPNAANAPRSGDSPQPNTTQEIEVNGIMSMDGKNIALINNKIYEVGESVGGMVVFNITPATVEFRQGDEIRILKVKK